MELHQGWVSSADKFKADLIISLNVQKSAFVVSLSFTNYVKTHATLDC